MTEALLLVLKLSVVALIFAVGLGSTPVAYSLASAAVSIPYLSWRKRTRAPVAMADG